MARGQEEKEQIKQKIMEVFDGAFEDGKTIRIPINGLEIKITLTAAKEAIDSYTNGLMTSNYEQWKNALASIYQEDLAQFTSAAMQKAAMNNLIMNSLIAKILSNVFYKMKKI